jgi:hypothetical protein
MDKQSKPSSGQAPSNIDEVVDGADVLAARMRSLADGEQLQEQLVVDNRVFARITDGIYRRPSSALRELIFNSYDADATEVTISTDWPRFERMSVSDNGNGMTEVALSNLLTHIGGSSKRTARGTEIGTASSDDPDLSPGLRRLIGKIGIGLFAVSHLTTHFQIITKARGERDWLIAEIWLMTYTEADLRASSKDGAKPQFVTGKVRMQREAAHSADEHGTTVTLFDIRPATRDLLRRKEMWEALLAKPEDEQAQKEQATLQAPKVHVGFSDLSTNVFLVEPALPWAPEDGPEERFRKFYQNAVKTGKEQSKNPDIEEYLDEYFAMLWRLSLAAPLEYLGRHPFEIELGGSIAVYKLENRSRGRAAEVPGHADQTVASALALPELADPVGGFSVTVDGVKLFRPVELPKELAESARPSQQKVPLLFVGQMKSSLGNYESAHSGGPLEFDAYFYWNTVIVPKQNRGVLIRINGASGVLYDDRFMDYQVSELNRLNQITGEVFVRSGMDAALNIDRESFNVSHPHYQYLSNWVHSCLRQITNLLKEASKKGRQATGNEQRSGLLAAIDKDIAEIWARRGDPLEQAPEVAIEATEQKRLDLRVSGVLAYEVSPDLLKSVQATANTTVAAIGPLEIAKAVFRVLAAYNVLDQMEYKDQEAMFQDVLQVLKDRNVK